jgi:hypothetical protein
VISLVLVAALAACGGAAPTPSPSPSLVATNPAATASIDPQARAAYASAICPIFTAILEIDPRLAAMRAVGDEDGDVAGQAAELAALTGELLDILSRLEEVPAWDPGNRLRFELITALHAIRTQLIVVGDDPSAATAAAALAATPFIATEAMDRAMAGATGAGLSCAPDE